MRSARSGDVNLAPRGRRVAAAALCAALAVTALGEQAEAADPSYGRVDGDLTLVAALGATVAPRGMRGEGELRLRYLETAGVFLSYEDGATLGAGTEPG